MACDIEKGINVLWRNADMAGMTAPVVVGNRLYATRNQDELVCLDPATGVKIASSLFRVGRVADGREVEVQLSGDQIHHRDQVAA